MARLLDQLVGHQLQVEKILTANEQKRLGHAYLFIGPSGIGKKTTALALAQALTCEISSNACGTCPSCLRVAAGSSENVLMVLPDGLQHKIEQARDILQFLSLKSFSKNRVVIIDEVNKMGMQAANALLKTLEEPPEGTVFFLISATQTGVLSTVRSRSQTLRFSPLKVSELHKLAPAPDWVLQAAQGRLENVRDLMETEIQELRALAFQYLMDFTVESPRFIEGAWHADLKERKTAMMVVKFWSSLVRDALLLKMGGQNFINQDQPDFIQKLSEWSEVRLSRLFKKILDLEESLKYRDVVLALEEMGLTI